MQAVDNGTLASVQYSRDNGATWTNLAANQQYGVTFSQNGTYDLRYRATDTGGNVSELGSVSFTIDLDAPNEPTVDNADDGDPRLPARHLRRPRRRDGVGPRRRRRPLG